MRIALLLLLSITLYADIKNELFELYQEKRYKEVCSIGFKYFDKFKKDEKYVSLYGFACLHVDYIDRLCVPATILKISEDSRANASYFAAIFLQKKILYHALLDNYNISSLNLPTTDYILSKVFDLYTKLKIKEPKEFYLLQDKDNDKIKYKLYILKNAKIKKMVIDELYESRLVRKHLYW